MSEQLGHGGDEPITIAQPVLFASGVAFNGVTTTPSKPTITTLPVTATTADIAAIGVAVNSVLNALSDLGLIVKGSS